MMSENSEDLVMLRSLKKGFTTIELLIVIAIIGVLAGIALFGGRQIINKQNENVSLQQFKQLLSRAATAANAQGTVGTLNRSGQVLKVTDSGGKTIVSMTLDNKVVTNIPTGDSLIFLPTGRISTASLAALPSLEIQAAGKTYGMLISSIGELKVEVK